MQNTSTPQLHPYLFLAAPGAGSYYIIRSWGVEMTYGSAALVTSSVTYLIYGSSGVTYAANPNGNLAGATEDCMSWVYGPFPTSGAGTRRNRSTIDNEPIYFRLLSNQSGGTGAT